jgi:hypothetical protein
MTVFGDQLHPMVEVTVKDFDIGTFEVTLSTSGKEVSIG